MPLLEDDGGDAVIICESRAIAHYLALKYRDAGPKLIPVPTDVKTRGVWEMWFILESIEFEAHFSPIVRETIIQP